LIAVRTLLWGGKQLTEAIAKKYELPFYEAKKEMELKGFILPSKSNASFDAKIFSDTISKSVRDLVRDLQLTFLELKTEFKCEIDQVFLTGGVSPLRGLGAFLTIQLDTPVNPIGIYSKFPQISFNTADFPEQRFGVALGIALEGIKKPRNPALQFLRNEFAQQNNFLSKVIQTYGRTLVYASIFFGLFLTYGFFRQHFAESAQISAEDNLKEQAVSSAKIPRKQATAQGIQKYLRDTKKRSSEIKVLSNVMQMNSAMDVLKKISETVPGKTNLSLDLHTLRIIDENVEMYGYVRNENEVRALQKELGRISSNGKITQNEPKLPALADKTAFSFTFKTDRNLNSSRE
jgi:general secretion pathway protein L